MSTTDSIHCNELTEPAVQEQFDPVRVFTATFVMASFAGLASLLRSGRKLEMRNVVSAMLNSGLLGLGIAFVWFNYLAKDVYFLIGVSLLAGLGGVTLMDFILMILRNAGLNVIVKISDDTREEK